MNIPKIENILSAYGNATPNQFVIRENSKTIFQSYNSVIAVIDRGEKKITIGGDWNYSNTTGKYRNLFFNDNGFEMLATLAGVRKAIKAGKTSDGYSDYVLEYNPEMR